MAWIFRNGDNGAFDFVSRVPIDRAGRIAPDLDMLFSAPGCTPQPICIRVTRVVQVGDLVQVAVFAGPRDPATATVRVVEHQTSPVWPGAQAAHKCLAAPSHTHKRRVLKHRVEA
jgi:hypothetical protein